ncbi:MAG: CidA/LrgA family protein [Rikenellaceae bacterium]
MVKAIRSSAIILGYYFLGVAISRLIAGVLPGSIIGMLLLFISLVFGWVKEQWIQPAVNFLLKYMVLFFLPASVGVMAVWDLVSDNLILISSIMILSTIVVLLVVGHVQQKLGKRW